MNDEKYIIIRDSYFTSKFKNQDNKNPNIIVEIKIKDILFLTILLFLISKEKKGWNKVVDIKIRIKL